MQLFIQRSEGNALWFILLAVALLGILTGVISRNVSSTNQSGEVEQNTVKASNVLQYTKSIEIAIQNMILSGASESDLDFVALGAAYDNPNCTDSTCEVFNVEGGGVTYRTASAVLANNNFSDNWFISTGNRIGGIGCDTASHGCRELLMLLPGVSDDFCKQVNRVMNISSASDLPQQQYVEEGAEFTGSFSDNINNYIIGGSDAANEAPEMAYKMAGCVQKFSGTAKNYFYQVLVAR